MAAHEDITDRNYHAIDLSSYGGTARGVDGPIGATLVAVYAPADAVCYMQFGTGITDATTDIATGGPVPTGTYNGVPCAVSDSPGPATGRPTIYLQGDTNVIVRFTGGGIG